MKEMGQGHLRAKRRRKVSSALKEPPHLKDESQEGMINNQGHEFVTPVPVPDWRFQQCVECVYQEDDQVVADSENYIHAVQNTEQDCMLRRGQKEE